MIIARYIAGNVLRAGAVVLLVLLVLFSFLALTETLDDVGRGRYSTADAISTVILTTPARAIDLLPVAALLGSVLGLGLLANNRELVAMRAGGMSAWKIAGVLATIAALLALGAALIQFFVIPPAERQAQEFRSHTLEQTAFGSTEFWSRRDQRVIRVGAVDFGRIPRAIEIYELGDDGRLSRMLRADRADVISAARWRLHNVEETVLVDDGVMRRHLDSQDWASFLSPDQVSTLIAPADALSALDLYRYLRESGDSGIDTRTHQALLWQQLSLPVTLLAMILLGLPLVLNAVQARSTGFRGLIGAAIGIGFYLFEQVTAHLAVLLELAPAVTALTPALLVLVTALAAIRRGAPDWRSNRHCARSTSAA